MQASTNDLTGLLVGSSSAGRYICPLAIREHEGWADIYTPLGFAGPVGSGAHSVFVDALAGFAASRRAVASYVGLHPMLGPGPLRASLSSSSDNRVYCVALDRPVQAVWASMSGNPRRQLQRLLADGGQLELRRGILTEAFVGLYLPFMQSKGATGTYSPSGETLRGLCAQQDVMLVGFPRDEPRAVAVFGATSSGAEYLYGVATPDARQYLLVLIWHAIEHFMGVGVPWLNLGGGVREGDSLAAFKRRLGGSPMPIIALKEVHLPDVYEQLCHAAGVTPDVHGYFPAYRSRSTR